ncbi:hypothetical protein PRIC2_011333 [Phytophthora ramorum]
MPLTRRLLDEQKEERGVFDFFKFKNLFGKNLAPTKALSQKILPSDTVMAVAQKNPTTSRLVEALGKNQPKLTEKDVSFFKKNPVFGKLTAIFAKKPAEITKKDIQLMQKTPGLSKAKSLLGTNPSTKSLRQISSYMLWGVAMDITYNLEELDNVPHPRFKEGKRV